MEILIIIFTLFACICLTAIIIYSIFVKEKFREEEEQIYFENRDNVHNNVFDDLEFEDDF